MLWIYGEARGKAGRVGHVKPEEGRCISPDEERNALCGRHNSGASLISAWAIFLLKDSLRRLPPVHPAPQNYMQGPRHSGSSGATTMSICFVLCGTSRAKNSGPYPSLRLTA